MGSFQRSRSLEPQLYQEEQSQNQVKHFLYYTLDVSKVKDTLSKRLRYNKENVQSGFGSPVLDKVEAQAF